MYIIIQKQQGKGRTWQVATSRVFLNMKDAETSHKKMAISNPGFDRVICFVEF